MKVLKIAIVALVTVFTFGAAQSQAQVRIHASIGSRPVHHRVVVVHHPVVVHHTYHRPVYHRPVVVVRHKPVYHSYHHTSYRHH